MRSQPKPSMPVRLSPARRLVRRLGALRRTSVERQLVHARRCGAARRGAAGRRSSAHPAPGTCTARPLIHSGFRSGGRSGGH